MTITEFRSELQLSLDGFAKLLGISSKSYVHDIENGSKPSVKIALELERLSDGRLNAAELNPDVALVRGADHSEAA